MIKEDAMFTAILTVMFAISDNPEFMYYSGVFMAAAVGLIMRVGYQLKNQIFTFRALGIQLLVGFPFTWLALKVHDTSDILHIWIFGYNFMALYLLDLLHKLGKAFAEMKYTDAIQYFLDRIKGKGGSE